MTASEARSCIGYPALAEWLVAHGAAPPALDEVNSLIAAVLAGDRDTATRLRAHAPEARERRPGLMAWAASGRKLDAIALLAELGFDVNARGRLDIPLEQPWFTPLHEAAQTGDVEMAQLLLGLGADPNIRSEWVRRRWKAPASTAGRPSPSCWRPRPGRISEGSQVALRRWVRRTCLLGVAFERVSCR